MEMTVAARSVHSTVYDPEGKTLDPQVWAPGHMAVTTQQALLPCSTRGHS